MKRKIFSKLLMVALVIAAVGSFVSCKDYDDDINNLQKQIDAKAAISQIENLQTQLTKAQSDATAAQQSATQALEEAKKKTTDEAVKKAIDEAIAKVNAAAEEAAKKTAEAIQKASDDAAAAAKAAEEAKTSGDAAAATAKEEAIAAAQEAAKKAADEAYAKALEAIKAEIAKISIPDVSGFLTKAQIEALISQNAQAKGDYVQASSLSTQLADLKTEILSEVSSQTGYVALDVYEAAIAKLYSAVTSVALYKANTNDAVMGGMWHTGDAALLNFIKVKEFENKFPTDAKKGEADNQYTFVKDRYITYEDSIVIRVSPASATVTPEMIEMINSQGNTLTSEVSVVKVARYNRLLTRADDNGNGLWVVTYKLKDGYNESEFLSSTAVDSNNDGKIEPWRSVGGADDNIAFAVAVNNTKNDAANRRVVSEYDVVVNTTNARHAGWFDVKVGSKAAVSAQLIHNRYTASEDATVTNTIEELVWKPVAGVANPAYTTVTTNAANAADANANAYVRAQADAAGVPDNRQAQQFIIAEVNEDIVIDFPNATTQPLKGFYVLLDRAYAVESAPSELNAWDSYEYDNVGTYGKPAHMIDGNTGTIRVKSANAQGDFIGFRVFAVNLDGTLVDPDGRAFYIHVGEMKTQGALVGTITVDASVSHVPAYGYYYSDYIAVGDAFSGLEAVVAGGSWSYSALTKIYGANTELWPFYGGATAAGNTDPVLYTVECYNQNKGYLGTINQFSTGGVVPSQVKYIRFVQRADRAARYVDDCTYYAKIEATKTVATAAVPMKTITFALTKKVPDTFKALQFRPKQEVDPTKDNLFAKGNDKEGTGYFIAYMVPGATPSANDYKTLTTVGSKELNNVFYRLDDNYEFSFAASKKNAAKNADIANVVTAGAAVTDGYSYVLQETHDLGTPANGLYIDGATWHDVATSYLYKNVSTYWDATNNVWNVAVNHKVANSVTYHALYACWHNAQSFAWVNTPKTATAAANDKRLTLQWAAPAAAAATRALADIQGSNSYDNTRFGLTLDKLVTTNGWLTVTTTAPYAPHLNTKADGTGQVDPYFGVTYAAATGFTFNQASTQVDAAPTADHTEYLIFYVTDAFRHPVMVSLPVTIKAPVKAAREK